MQSKACFGNEILASRRSQARQEHQHREHSEIANTRSIRAFHAVFRGSNRVRNHTDKPNQGKRFQHNGNKPNACRLQGCRTLADIHEQCVMHAVLLQENIANHYDCRKLQNITNQRYQSTVRTLAFGNARFIVYVEYAYFTAAETADEMHCEAKPKRNVCVKGQRRCRAAKRIDKQVVDNNASKARRENIPERIHCVNIRIQAVNTANLLLEQVFQMRQRLQDTKRQHEQRQQIQHGRCKFDNRPHCSEVVSLHRSKRALHADRGIIRGQQRKTGYCRKRNQGKEIHKPHSFRSATALVDTPANKRTMLRGHRFDFVLFHLSKPPTVFTNLRAN